jgi:3-oxoacyl-[acyl-carrier-protein] synthase-1
MKIPISITASTLISSLGQGRIAHLHALKHNKTGLSKGALSINTKLNAYFGEVPELLTAQLPESLQHFDSRNNRLANLALHTDGFFQMIMSAKERYGSNRLGIVEGTSTSGILATEEALEYKLKHGHFPKSYQYEHTHRMNALADFCSTQMDIHGPSLTISTACSSSTKVFATASRWIDHGLVDAVIVGGVDTLCLTTIHGFDALGLISPTLTKPLDKNRNGINIGEAAGFMLLEKTSSNPLDIQLKGYGETSDAYHISTPHPEGEGAFQAMGKALKMAGLKPPEIDYLNLHGTGTLNNDQSESLAVTRIFDKKIPLCSSTKGFTGHTLGASGITEAYFCQLALEEQFVPSNLNLTELDTSLKLTPVIETHDATLKNVMSNSFGFGGNNASLIFSLPESIL